MNIWDILILAGVAAAVFFALRSVRKSGKNGCSGGCAGCDRACNARGQRK